MARKAYNGYTEKSYYENTKYYGIVATTDPLAEGYFRDIINFDISDTGASLKPRTGFLTTSIYSAKVMSTIDIDLETSVDGPAITDNKTYMDLRGNIHNSVDDITESCIKVAGSNLYEITDNLNISDAYRNELVVTGLPNSGTVIAETLSPTDVIAIPKILCRNLLDKMKSGIRNTDYLSISLINPKLTFTMRNPTEPTDDILICKYDHLIMSSGTHPLDSLFNAGQRIKCKFNTTEQEGYVTYTIVNNTYRSFTNIIDLNETPLSVKITHITIELSGVKTIGLCNYYISQVGTDTSFYLTMSNIDKSKRISYINNECFTESIIDEYPEDEPSYYSLVLRKLMWNLISYVDDKNIIQYGRVNETFNSYSFTFSGFNESDPKVITECLHTQIADLRVGTGTRYNILYTSLPDIDTLNYEEYGLDIIDKISNTTPVNQIPIINELRCGNLSKFIVKPVYKIQYTNLSGVKYILNDVSLNFDINNETYRINHIEGIRLLHSLNGEIINVNDSGNLYLDRNLFYFYYAESTKLYRIDSDNSDPDNTVNIYNKYTDSAEEEAHDHNLVCNTIECQALTSLKNIDSNVDILIRPANVMPTNIDLPNINRIEFMEGIENIKANTFIDNILNYRDIYVYLPSTLKTIEIGALSSHQKPNRFYIHFSNNTSLDALYARALHASYCYNIISALKNVHRLEAQALADIFSVSGINGKEISFYNKYLFLGLLSLAGFTGTINSVGAGITPNKLLVAGLQANNYTLNELYEIKVNIYNDDSSPVKVYIDGYKENNHPYNVKSILVSKDSINKFELCTLNCNTAGLYIDDYENSIVIAGDERIQLSGEYKGKRFPYMLNCTANDLNENTEITITVNTNRDNELDQKHIYFNNNLFFTFMYNHWNIYITYYEASKILRGFINYDLSSNSVISENFDNLPDTHSLSDDIHEHMISIDKLVNEVKPDELLKYIVSMYPEYSDKQIYEYLRVDEHIASTIIDEYGVSYGLINIKLLNTSRSGIKQNILVKLLYNSTTNIVELLPYNTQTNYSISEKNIASHLSLIPDIKDMQNIYKYEDIVNTVNSSIYTQVTNIYARNKYNGSYYINYYNCPTSDIELIPSFTIIDYSNKNLKEDSFRLVPLDNNKYEIQLNDSSISAGLDNVYCYEIYSTESLIKGQLTNVSSNIKNVYRSPIFLLEDNTNISEKLYKMNYYIYDDDDKDYLVHNVYTGLSDTTQGTGVIDEWTIYDGSIFNYNNGVLSLDLANFDTFSSRNLSVRRYLYNGIIIVFHLMQVPYNAFIKSYNLSLPENNSGKIIQTNPYATLLSYDAMVATSGVTTQSIVLLPTTDASIVTTINQIDKTIDDQLRIDLFDGYCIFNSTEGDRMTVWKDVHLYMTVAANASNTEGFFTNELHFTFDEPIVKVLPYRNILIVFTTMNVYTIYPYTDTHLVNVQEQDDEGDITVKQQQQEYTAYAKMCVLYNILCDKKYADAIQIFNQMILFYSSDGQMYLIKPSATIDSDTRFNIQYFNKNANDILANYDKYIQERLSVYNIDLQQKGYITPTITKDMVNIKVLASINYIKVFYSIPNVITYILIYDVINNRWLAYDTVSFTDVTDVTFIESGDLYITRDNDHLYLTLPYKDLYIPNNNCDMSIVNNFQKEPINAEFDTGNLDLNNHLRKRFRNLKTVYKNLDATSLKFKTEVILDDVLIETFADNNLNVRNINDTTDYKYDYVEEQPDVELLDNQTVLFDISAFTSNKILTHTRSIVSVGKVIRFKLHFSSSGCYKVNSYGIIYKERTV